MKKMYRLTWVMLAIGLIVIAYGFTQNPFLPYQDPNPELIAKFNRETKTSELIMSYGFWLCLASLFLKLIIRSILKIKK